jgi:hypothetical protein
MRDKKIKSVMLNWKKAGWNPEQKGARQASLENKVQGN